MYKSGVKIIVLRDKNRHDRLRSKLSPNQSFPMGPALQRLDNLESGSSSNEVPPDTDVVVETSSKSVIEDIAHDVNVVAVAESMPIALLRTVSDAELIASEVHTDTSDLAGTTGTAWGIRAVGADSSLIDGSKAVVCVLDTGIDRSHPAFNDPNLELLLRNFTPGSDVDEDGHGTHCAGTIFGRDVDGIRIGVAPGVRKALIGKVIGNGAGTDSLIDAMEWASNEGANIISMSLGFDFPQFQADLEAQGIPKLAATSMALQAYRDNLRLFDQWMAFNKAKVSIGRGSIVIAAGGNESRRNASVPFEIAVSSPAAAIDVISVGALADGDSGLTVASFSNTGPKISAPGVSVVSAKLGGGLTALNGTSMACPHVAGVAALIWHDMMESPVKPTPERVAARLLGDAEHAGVFTSQIDFADVGVGIARSPG